MASFAGPVDRSRKVASEHRGRIVYDEGDHFVKIFLDEKERDEELDNLRKLNSAGVATPEILDTSDATIVTRTMQARPLDELIAERWSAMARRERNRLIEQVAEVCRKVRDAGYDWPDLVTYHLYVGDGPMRVLDPARLRRGKLELSPLFYSCEEPTITRTERLRFWRAYAGDRKPPRLRRIGHRGRFRPYRWVPQRGPITPVPSWAPFVNAIDAPYASVEEVAEHPELSVWREQADRVNATLGDLFVKITTDPAEAEREWSNHQLLLGVGFRAPQPAVGGLLADGRALFSSVKLKGLYPMDEVWETLDPRLAVQAAADIARRLHAGGLVHKDLYLCHLFVPKGAHDVTLIDLARVTRTTSRRLRVKDLAALLHSAKQLCTRTQLWRGLKRYGGDKRLARSVLRKERRMARHVPRNVQDGTHQPYRP
ncbi:MAG: lipopolysaccharide kinase InaA family protein [Planctomycetota bacterium]|jgi:tRNA A-37 threonylcarbamoyl transferase component Bud32